MLRKQGRLYGDCYSRSSATVTPTNTSCNDGEVEIPAHPDNIVTITDFRIDEKSLEAYRKICSSNTTDLIPLCYLESLFLRLLALLASSSTCQVSPLGLIHIKQTITQHQPLDHLINSAFDLQARLIHYKMVERGIEGLVEFRVIDKHGICVWEGSMTVLSRNSKAQKSGSAKNKGRKNDTERAKNEDATSSLLGESVVHVPGDMGIQYAQATGDWNPHHLYPWTAKLLGYRAPIAHGMWTLARTLDEVLHNDKVPKRYPIHVDCAFKRPVFMPGEANIKYGMDNNSGEKSVYWFNCTEKTSGVPHLVGTLQLGS